MWVSFLSMSFIGSLIYGTTYLVNNYDKIVSNTTTNTDHKICDVTKQLPDNRYDHVKINTRSSKFGTVYENIVGFEYHHPGEPSAYSLTFKKRDCGGTARELLYHEGDKTYIIAIIDRPYADTPFANGAIVSDCSGKQMYKIVISHDQFMFVIDSKIYSIPLKEQMYFIDSTPEYDIYDRHPDNEQKQIGYINVLNNQDFEFRIMNYNYDGKLSMIEQDLLMSYINIITFIFLDYSKEEATDYCGSTSIQITLAELLILCGVGVFVVCLVVHILCCCYYCSNPEKSKPIKEQIVTTNQRVLLNGIEYMIVSVENTYTNTTDENIPVADVVVEQLGKTEKSQSPSRTKNNDATENDIERNDSEFEPGRQILVIN